MLAALTIRDIVLIEQAALEGGHEIGYVLIILSKVPDENGVIQLRELHG